MAEHESTEDLDFDIESIFENPDEPIVLRTLLEIWRELLSNIEHERVERISANVAQKIVATWPKLDFKDVPAYLRHYYDLLAEQRLVVLAEIHKDPAALKYLGEEDPIENREHYEEILFGWNLNVARWEREWDVTDPEAAIKLAAIIDAQGFFLAQTGLVAHLSEIGFEFTEADGERLVARLQAAKEEL